MVNFGLITKMQHVRIRNIPLITKSKQYFFLSEVKVSKQTDI